MREDPGKIRKLSRILAVLRRDYPLLFFIPPFVLGQLGGCMLGEGPQSLWIILALLPLLTLNWWLRWGWVVASAALGILSCLSFNPHALEYELSEHRSYYGEVVGRPRYRPAGGIEFPILLKGEFHIDSDPSSRSASTAEHHGMLSPLTPPPTVLCKGAYLPWRNSYHLRKGSEVVIKARFKPIKKSSELFTYLQNLHRRGFRATCKLRFMARLPENSPSFIERVRQRLTQSVYQTIGSGERAGLLLGMSIGKRDGLTRQTEWAFKRTGLAHVLVVSGYQITLIHYSIVYLVRWLLAFSPVLCALLPSTTIAQLTGALVSLGYVLLVGAEGPALRALTALGIILIASILERGQGMLNAILFSFVILALIWPGSFLDPSLQLTYAALLGICLGSSRAMRLRSRLGGYLIVCTTASISTTLVVAAWFGHFSLVSLVVNPIFAPLAAILGCKVAIIGELFLLGGVPGAELLVQLVSWLLLIYRDLVVLLSEVSFSALSTRAPLAPFCLLGLGAALVVLCVGDLRRYLLRRNALK